MSVERYTAPDSITICDVVYRKNDWIHIQFGHTNQSTLQFSVVRLLARVTGFITGGPDGVAGVRIKDKSGEEFTVLKSNIHFISKRLGIVKD